MLTVLEYSVILLGLDNAGKTTFHEQVKSLFANDPSTAPPPNLQTVPTVGQNVSTITLPDMYMKLWDVGGQMSLRRLWQSYYQSCHAIVFIIDSTDIGDLSDTISGMKAAGGETTASRSGSISASQGAEGGSSDAKASSAASGAAAASGEEVSRLDECRMVLEDVLQHSDTEGVPLLILANKQDREDCVEVVRIKEGLVKKVFEGEKASSIRDSRVLPVSALTGTGVSEAVEWLRSRVKWNKESRPPVRR